MAVILQKTLEGNNGCWETYRKKAIVVIQMREDSAWTIREQGAGGMVRSGQSLKIKPVRYSDWLYVSGKEKNQG